MNNLHNIEPSVDVAEYLAAQSRAAGNHDGAAVDLNALRGEVHFEISAGTFGASATLDAKIQESDDGSSFTDVSPAKAITQLTAAGSTKLTVQVRSISKRYIRVRAVVAVQAVVFGVTKVALPLSVQ